MRKFLGFLVLTAGAAGLGYVATTQNAPRIQAAIDVNAQAVADGTLHGLSAVVSGRDVRVSGLVTDPTELAVLQATFEGIDGVRVVDMADVETLPLIDPFALMALKEGESAVVLSGAIPSEVDRAQLGVLAAGLKLAAGAPDADWINAAGLGIAALEELKSGEMTLEGREISLSGLARTPNVVVGLRSNLDTLPDGYSARLDIDVEDDGTPLRLMLSLRDGVVSGGGKLPSQMSEGDVSERFEIGDPLALTEAAIPSIYPDWPDATGVGMDALAALIEAELAIEGQAISLIGTGTPSGVAQAQELLATLPTSYDVTSDLGLWDDGVALSLIMEWDGSDATASGKFPDGFAARGPTGVAVTSDAAISFLPDEAGTFTSNADAGVAALGLLQSGQLIASETSIKLSGVATTPQINVVMDDVLAALGDDVAVERNITYLDDGSPAAWSLTYDAANGARVEGRLPDGMQVQDLQDALGTGVTGSPTAALADTDVGSSLDALTRVAGYLPELESLTFARDGGGTALDLIVAPGVDFDLVASDLAENLPPDVAFSLAPLEDFPAEGTMRVNAATGLNEVFSRGFWLPNLEFTADLDGCNAQVDALLNRAKITFLSGSARLDATSIRAINGLAALAASCFDADLLLDIGGHTDASGDEDGNIALSAERAEAVRAALIDRGLRAADMFATGFGPSQPVADNETAEGRAANRRTTLTWVDSETP
ncbi:OmpA family protein [Octadecabacter sp. 1_MG-2023]|uniref:OmpA family protein n=1 Tax=unclassified Octadecabacter TaxID=196158 RepID=UPI0026E15FC6|nr:OmpA family protein [Octadecabacter sp. 1_MG-2023]MDO6734511.1 OmpA family protein [Octadecabacter sp. 1_MG-2023]